MEFALVLHEKSAADADGLIHSEAINLIDMLSGKEYNASSGINLKPYELLYLKAK